MTKKEQNTNSTENPSENQKKNRNNIQKQILENLVALQKVHTNLAEKFDSLSQQISDLLRLFESAAKSFSESPMMITGEKDKEFLDKIDRLLEQNKTIAKGLTLMEERIRERVYGVNRPQIMPPINQAEKREDQDYQQSSVGKPLPKF